MQNLLIKIVAAGALLAAATPVAAANFRAQARLVEPAKASTVNVDGVEWRCGGKFCTSAPQKGDLSLMQECRNVVAALGQVKAYNTHGRDFSLADLKTCNVAATEAPTETAEK